jgi:hypothetical protein
MGASDHSPLILKGHVVYIHFMRACAETLTLPGTQGKLAVSFPMPLARWPADLRQETASEQTLETNHPAKVRILAKSVS